MSKNDFNNIKVPRNIHEYVNKGLDKAESELKLRKKRSIKKNIGIVASIVIVLLTIGIANPALAESIPILKDIFKVLEKTENPNMPESNYLEYTNELAISQEYNGIKITIEETLYDGESIYVSYKIESEEEFPYLTHTYPTEYITLEDGMIVDGKNFVENPIDYIFLEEKIKVDYSNVNYEMSWPKVNGMLVDNKTFIGVRSYDVINWKETGEGIESIQVPESFELNIKIPSFSLPVKNSDQKLVERKEVEHFYIEGNWEFNIPVKLDKSIAKDREFKEKYINEVKDGFMLEKIMTRSFYTKVKIVPLNPESQKNIIDPDGLKTVQLHSGYLIGSDGDKYNYSQPSSSEFNKIDGDIDGTFYITVPKDINNKQDYYEVVVEDNLQGGQPCTDECENPEYHANSSHPKVIKFDTKL